MPILNIRKYPDQILKKKCEEVAEINLEINKLIGDMIETMQKNNGVGLAAPQIGVLKRIIVLDSEKGAVAFVNPRILKKSKEKEIMEEGCLSFPGIFYNIKRPKEIEAEVLTEDGEKIKIKMEGLLSRVFQHEVDHLDGILFIDRLPLWQRLKSRNKLKEKIKKEP